MEDAALPAPLLDQLLAGTVPPPARFLAAFLLDRAPPEHSGPPNNVHAFDACLQVLSLFPGRRKFSHFTRRNPAWKDWFAALDSFGSMTREEKMRWIASQASPQDLATSQRKKELHDLVGRSGKSIEAARLELMAHLKRRGKRTYSESSWKAYLAPAQTIKARPVPDVVITAARDLWGNQNHH